MRTTRAMAWAMVVCGLVGAAGGAVKGPGAAPHKDLPGDKPRKHVEATERSGHEYVVNFAGSVDGAMTRGPIGYKPFEQGWQPNRSVRIENIGDADVRNPRVVVNGKRAWWTIKDIVADATAGAETDAERARAVYEFTRRHRFHACTWDGECDDALKVLHVYGYTLCGNESRVINDLWKTAGLTPRRGYPVGHSITEVLYDGAYHLMDSDEHVICLKRDNRTIASCEEIVRDHDLMKRTHTYGILHEESRRTDEYSASLYVYEGKRQGDKGFSCRHSMDLTLRAGESIELRWDHVGKQYTAGSEPKPGQRGDGVGGLDRWGPAAYEKLRNGKVRYRPDLSGAAAEAGAAVENARFDRAAGAILPAGPGKPATVTWQFAAPYVFVGGTAAADVKLAAGGSAEWRFSADGKTWQKLPAADKAGEGRLAASVDEVISPRGRPTYRFFLQLALSGGAAASNVAFEHDVQTSVLPLPELEAGDNRVVYTDANGPAGKRQVRVTHEWVERTTWHPPAAPAEALEPKDGATVEGSAVTFRWAEPKDPDGDRIADYHFELSDRADMRWPLSPTFERLSSRTPAGGKPTWTVPLVGLLNPDTTYCWRVRARDEKGVWGPWSKVFRFKCQAPGVPLAAGLEADGGGGFTLRWRPNPQGRAPAAYKVYGSDEKGFSVSDSEYLVHMGKGFVAGMAEYEARPPASGGVKTPANLIAKVAGTSLAVAGAGLTAPNTNKAFYRVVAIDSAGNESGPSDYAEAPRPLPVVPAQATARLNAPFALAVGVIRSLGDLRCRASGKSSYNSAYWDRQEVTLSAEGLPEGLALDPRTARIAGTPTQAGEFTITLTAADQSGKKQAAALKLVVGR